MRPCYVCHQRGIGNESVVYLRTYRLALCGRHLKEWIERRTREAIAEFGLIEPDDRMLVAVSGGKDSLALWWILSEIGYEADGLFIDLGIPGFSERSRALCQRMAERLGRELFVVAVDEFAGETIADVAGRTRKVCALCGKYKRRAMNEFARMHGYTSIATGHHLLDEAGSLLYNLVNWSTKFLKGFGPKKQRTDELPAKIKPFVKVLPQAIKALCEHYGIEYQKERCPYSKGAKTPLYEDFLTELDELSPGLIHRFYFQGLKLIGGELNLRDGEDEG